MALPSQQQPFSAATKRYALSGFALKDWAGAERATSHLT